MPLVLLDGNPAILSGSFAALGGSGGSEDGGSEGGTGMGYLDSLLNVQVVAAAQAITQQGFSTPLALAAHNFWPQRVRKVSGTAELTSLGVPATDPVFLMVQAFEANGLSGIVVGKRTRLFTQVFEFTPEPPSDGKVYSLTIDGEVVEYTAGGSDTVDDVVDGLIADAAGLVADVTPAGGPGAAPYALLRVTADTAGELHAFTAIEGLSVFDATANPGSGGIAQDFAEVRQADDTFFGVCIDSQSKAEVLALAPAIEAARKKLAAFNADTANGDPESDDDLCASVQTGGYASCMVGYHHKPLQYLSGCIFGRQMPKQPGSTNYAWQAALVGVDASELSQAFLEALDAKNGNHYSKAIDPTFGTFLKGRTGASWMDTVDFVAWMRARMRERLTSLFVNAEKIGQTAIGIGLIEAQIRAQIADGIRVGGLDPDFETEYTIPEISSIPVNDLANRVATGFAVRHRLASPFNEVDPLLITLTI